MPIKSKVLVIPEAAILDNKIKKADIKIKQGVVINDKQSITVDKITVLERLLTAIVPKETTMPTDFTTWEIAIHDPNYRGIIEDKLIELVKKL